MNKSNNFRVVHMVCLMALNDNKFSLSNAGLDMGISCSYVSYYVRVIDSYFGYPVFTRGYKKYCREGDGILGFTKEGQNLYFSAKTFLESVMLVGGKND